MRKHLIVMVGGAILGATLALVVGSLVNRVREEVDAIVTPTKTDTIYMEPEVVDRVIEEAKNPPKPGIVERITTAEVKPDSVRIAKKDPQVVASEPLELPDYMMVKVEKEDKSLVVTSVRSDGTEAQEGYYSLPDKDSDYTLTSGARPATLRTDRTWNIIELEAELLLLAGAGGVTVTVVGPVGINITPDLKLSPAASLGSDGSKIGAAIRLDF